MAKPLFSSPSNPRAASAAAAATQADYQVRPGSVYRGTIVGRNDDTNLYVVQTEDPVVVLPACVFAAGLVTSLLGVRTSTRLQPGVRCLVVAGTPSFIINCFEGVPTPDAGTALDANSTAETGQSAAMKEQAGGVPSFIPNDMQEGELQLGSLTGTALQLLTSVARIKAGDRASIEAHMQNDMVRILSNTFRHHSALGDHEVYEKDGKLHGRWSFTSRAHEAWGSVSEEEFAKIEEFQASSEADTLRSRFDLFLGHAGDFLTMVLQDPMEVLGTLGTQGRPKLRMHVNMDGSFLLQGMGDIVIEHTSQIAAPFAKTAAGEEPKGTSDGGALEPHDAIEDAMREADPIALAYALRSYSRWFTDTHAVQRFLQNPEAYGVAVTPPENPYECAEADKKDAAPTWRSQYATVRLNRDGSVNVLSEGASLLMANGNVQVTAPKDLLLEAGGTLTLRAGRNILALARGHVEIVSVLGGIFQKCRDAWKVFSENGRLHLRTDFALGASNPDPDTSENIVDYLPDQPGIIIEGLSTGAAVLVNSGVQLQVTEGDVSILGSNSEKNVLRVANFHKVLVRAKTMIFRGDVWSTFVERAVLFATQALSINDRLVVEGGQAEPEGRNPGIIFRALAYFRNGLYSAQDLYGPRQTPQPVSDGAPTGKQHLNHIRENKLPSAVHDTKLVASELIPDLAELATAKGNYLTAEGPLLPSRIEWALPDPRVYAPTQAPELFRSLSQEWLELQSGQPGVPTSAELSLSDIRLLGGRIPWRTPHFPATNNWSALNSGEPVLGVTSPNLPGTQLKNELVSARIVSFRYTPAS